MSIGFEKSIFLKRKPFTVSKKNNNGSFREILPFQLHSTANVVQLRQKNHSQKRERTSFNLKAISGHWVEKIHFCKDFFSIINIYGGN